LLFFLVDLVPEKEIILGFGNCMIHVLLLVAGVKT